MVRQFPDLGVDVPEITPVELKRRLDDGEPFTILDTRRPDDFDAWHLTHPQADVVNVPFTAFLDDDDNPREELPADLPDDSPADLPADLPDELPNDSPNDLPSDELPNDSPEELPDGPLVCCCAEGKSSYYVAQILASEGRDVLALLDGMAGWAELYEQRMVDVEPPETEVVQFHRPSSGCLSYLFVHGSRAAVVDPLRAFSREYIQAANTRGATLEYALDTHVHADHVSGVREVAELTDATVVLPDGAIDRGLEYDPTFIEHAETLALEDGSIEAIALPGHTSEMTGYRFNDLVATGDTIFLDGVARPDLEDEDGARELAGRLWETLRRLDVLPDEVLIAPGHVSPITSPRGDGTFVAKLGELRANLAAFEESEEEFVERVLADLGPRPKNYERIIEINLGREQVGSPEAFELELGPNNCAVMD